MSIRQFIEISTSHVSEQTGEWLNAEGLIAADFHNNATIYAEVNMASTHFGWFLYCDEDVDALDCPDDLKAVMRWVRAQGLEYVLFDRDADQVEGLPTFDW